MNIERVKFGKNEGSPQEILSELVGQLEPFLNQLVDSENNYLIYENMQPKLLDAWPEVEERFPPYIKSVKESDIDKLKKHGLTDKQLDLKIASVNFAADNFFNAYEKEKKTLACKWLKKTFEIIDIIFKSLLKAVPGGGAIEEYKSICESLIPDDEKD